MSANEAWDSMQKPNNNNATAAEIVVAEDSATQAEQLAELLEAHGYSARIAPDGLAALAAIRSHKPDLVVSDVIMPGLDGYGLCRALKDDPATSDIPVLLVTSLTDPSDVIRGLECGADNFVRKPYESDSLIARIDHLLVNRALRQTHKTQVGIEINLEGRRYFVSAERQQMLDMLISTFEEAVHLNRALALREESLRRSNQMLHGLYRVTEGLNGVIGEQAVAQTVVERLMELPGVEGGWIVLRDAEAGLRRVAARNLPPVLCDSRALEGACRCHSMLLTGAIEGPIDIVACEHLARACVETWGMRGHICVPIRVDQQLAGVLNLIGHEAGLLAENDNETLATVANQLGVALSRAREHDGLERLVAARTANLAAEVEQRKRAQADQARLVAILDATPDFVATTSPDHSVTYINVAGRRLLGLSPRDDPSRLEFAQIYPDRVRCKVLDEGVPRAISEGSWSGESVLLAADGREIPVLQVIVAHRSADGAVQYLSTIARDISALKAQEARIQRLNRVHAVLSGVNTTIMRVDHRQELFEDACRIAVDLGGYVFAWIGALGADAESVKPLATAGRGDGYLEDMNLSLRADAQDRCDLTAEAMAGATPVVCNEIAMDERMVRWRDAALRRGFRSVALLPLTLNGVSAGVFVLYSPEPHAFDDAEMRLLAEMAGNISFAIDHLEKSARLDHLAYYDTLTDLPNRRLFLDRVAQRIKGARRDAESCSLIMVDLERFSEVNATLGRERGDELLRYVAGRLCAILAGTDVIARVGANCFGIAMQREEGNAAIGHAIEAIMADFARPFVVAGRELRIAARAGIATFPDDSEDAEGLYNNAEAALRKAKQSAEQYLFYTPEINRMVAENLLIENKLRAAIERRELALSYQPKVSFASGGISGVEALMRWSDPASGPVPPVKFIPILERTGLILAAGQWALEQALADASRWSSDRRVPLPVAINVSAMQLRRDDFVSVVERALAASPGVQLEIEITESMIVQDVEAVIAKLKALRAMGVGIAIDDFGTGYSSLSYIARLPVTSLKVDRSFISNMTMHPDDLGIVASIISLAHSLRTRVIAEGVETGEQAKLLRLLRCDEIQGFLFSESVSADEITAMMAEGRSLEWPS